MDITYTHINRVTISLIQDKMYLASFSELPGTDTLGRFQPESSSFKIYIQPFG